MSWEGPISAGIGGTRTVGVIGACNLCFIPTGIGVDDVLFGVVAGASMVVAVAAAAVVVIIVLVGVVVVIIVLLGFETAFDGVGGVLLLHNISFPSRYFRLAEEF